MVFQPISKAEATLEEEEEQEIEEKEEDSLSSMATVPVKSQPLHNFSLPLKWGKNQTNNQRCRKPNNNNESSRGDSPSIDHQQNQNHRSSASDVESDGGSSQKDHEIVNQKNTVGSRTVKNRFPVSASSNGGVGVGSGSPSMTNKADEVRSSNLVIRIPKGSKEESVSKNKSVVVAGGGGSNGGGVEGGVAEGVETEEPVTKPWNLRPRRAVVKTNNQNNNNNNENGGGVIKNGGGGEGEMEEKQENQQPKSLRLKRGVVETENVEKKKEKKIIFSIPLSREDVEDDFYRLTGSKPPRRPKKRNRVVQKQLDNIFPGLWLSGITADSYSVPEAPAKKLKN